MYLQDCKHQLVNSEDWIHYLIIILNMTYIWKLEIKRKKNGGKKKMENRC